MKKKMLAELVFSYSRPVFYKNQENGDEKLLLLLLLLFIGKPQQAFKASLQGARDIS